MKSRQQLSVPLQPVPGMFFSQPFWCSCIASFRTPVGFFFLFFVFFGLMPVSSSSSSFLFRRCSSYLFPLSTYVVLLAVFLIFLHHTLQNSCRSGFFIFLVLIFLIFLVWLVLFCSRTRYASISLALPWLIAFVSVFLCLSLWPHNLYL